MDHVAIQVSNIPASIRFYRSIFGNDLIVLYADDSWAIVSIQGSKLAFVKKDQHPPHIAFIVNPRISMLFPGKKMKMHRDGSNSFYIRDLDGNHIEFIRYPEKKKMKIWENIKMTLAKYAASINWL